MARKMTAQEAARITFARSTRSTRPYAEWMDGSTWVLDADDIGDAKVESLKEALRAQARKVGKRVQIRVDGEGKGLTITLRAYIPDEAPTADDVNLSKGRRNGRARKDA